MPQSFVSGHNLAEYLRQENLDRNYHQLFINTHSCFLSHLWRNNPCCHCSFITRFTISSPNDIAGISLKFRKFMLEDTRWVRISNSNVMVKLTYCISWNNSCPSTNCLPRIIALLNNRPPPCHFLFSYLHPQVKN